MRVYVRQPWFRPAGWSRTLALALILTGQATLQAGCNRSPQEQKLNTPMIAPVSKAEIAAAASKRVIFAHQSVGNDILDGARTLAADAGVPLNVVESREAPSDANGIFHFKVGTNGVPLGKIEEFRNTLSQAQLADVDVALVKLCYIDFNRSTDAAQLATAYVQAIDELQQRHPRTLFAAMTAPLTTIQTGPKAWVKRLLGKTPAGYVENAKREQFNAVLRQRFDESHLFDVARIEARGGQEAARFEYEGRQLDALDPGLSSDGGHLNDAGKRVVGSAFVKFLGNSQPST
jgi:hypothetical protein